MKKKIKTKQTSYGDGSTELDLLINRGYFPAEARQYRQKFFAVFDIETLEENGDNMESPKALSLVSIGIMWLKMSDVAHRKISENKDFYKSKIDCANIFFTRILTRIDAYSNVKSSSDTIMNYNFKN